MKNRSHFDKVEKSCFCIKVTKQKKIFGVGGSKQSKEMENAKNMTCKRP